MTKKSINRKEVSKKIQTRLQDSISREKILEELSEKYYDKKTISTLIASTPDSQKKEKFKILNNLLLGLLITSIFIKILVGIQLLSSISLILIPVAFLIPFISIWFALEVFRYKGYVYNILGLLAIASIFKTLSDIGESGVYGIIDLIIVASIAGLSLYIGKKMFPNYGLFGPKKDTDGNIILE